ncbi:MAG: 1-acyl-sn-glycerol-3-phosphate acyltransferase [Oscillospiraceae bacterium]|nr:1-acyl-sn-glycerol-3-phosphate acyltransferase [Oscillospiraceae bacterium]
MYFRHNLPYEYPEKCDAHMIDVKHLRDVHLDENYPYLQKSAWFKCQRGLLWICQQTILPIVMWVVHGLRIHGKEKLKQHKDLLNNGLMTISNHVFMWDYICLMVALRPRLGFFPAWKINLEGPNGPLIRMAGGIPVPTDSLRPMIQFKKAMEEVLDQGKWMHFFPEGSMWFYYPDIRPLKKAVFKYAVTFDRPILPLTFSFRPRTGLWKLLGKTPLVDLNIEDPIYHDRQLPKLAAVKKMQSDAYRIMQQMNGIYPGDPTYNEDLNLENYQKTM